MKFRFFLNKGITIPIFKNKLGVSNTQLSVCLDTGCGLTTFYMSYKTVKAMYPDISKTDDMVTCLSANGEEDSHDVYIIPEFVLTDKDNNKLYIKNLYCCIENITMPHIDILLSSSIFFNADVIIKPIKMNTPESTYRAFIVDTYDNRDSLIMQCHINKNRKLYIGALKEVY